MNRLLQYVPKYNSKNDSISFEFEVLRENIVQVNKFYYDSESFIAFLKKRSIIDNELTNFLGISYSSIHLNFHDFMKSIGDLALEMREDNRQKSDSLLFEIENFNSSINKRDEELSNETVSIFVEHISDILLGYQYKFNDERHKHVFNNSLIEEIKKTIELLPAEECPEDIRIKPYLAEKYRDIDDPKLYEFRVYNVGQANCSALIKYTNNLREDYSVVAVFDFGMENRVKNNSLKEMINKIDFDTTIVISHFDLDHINNISKFALRSTCRWLFPEHIPSSHKANLLYHELVSVATKKSYSGVRVFSYRAPFDMSNYLRISQNTSGVKDVRFQSNRKNAESIICTLSINDKNILIPADALYKDFPAEIFDREYDYVLIPHHGCYYDYDLDVTHNYFDEVRQICNSKPVGILQSGYRGALSYGHTNVRHLSWYSNIIAFPSSQYFDRRLVRATFPVVVFYRPYISIKF